MAKNKHIIRYTETFINQFNNILRYFLYNLKNEVAAEKFYKEVIEKIEKRSLNPESFEMYKSAKKRKNIYYRIYVKNYIIFYTVRNNKMEITNIIYNARNIKNLI